MFWTSRKIFGILVLFASLTSLAYSLTINNHEIRDLESTSSSFNTEASFWSIQGNFSAAMTSQCSGTWIMGGYHITGNGGEFTRTYTGLPSHNTIYFSVYMWQIDTQESADLFRIYFDGVLVSDWNSNGYSFTAYPAPNVCGGSLADYTNILIGGKAPHSASTLTFKLASMYNSASNSFQVGFRNLNLLFQNSPTTTTTSACAFASQTDLTVSSCLCGSNQYDPVGSSSCAACNSICKTCTGSNANTACTSCPSGSSYDGLTCMTCHSSCDQCKGTTSTDCVRCPSGRFLYPDGTCLPSCSSPFVTVADGQYQSCSPPCASGEYYYQNGTCLSSCTSPFTQSSSGGVTYCNFPCSSSNYYYSNGSCLSSCPTPYSTVSKSTYEKYCQSPCLSSQYYYQNNTCQSSCTSPFVQSVQGVLTFCNFPCSGSNYLYSNGSCLSCNTPFTSITKGSVERYCQSPCSSSQYYFANNNSCGANCYSPFVAVTSGELQSCNSPCTSSQYLYWNNTCEATCTSPLVATSSASNQFCNLPCALGEYYYQNNTCSSSCNSPFTQSNQGDLKYCNFACSSSSDYLYSNYSCLSSCSSPFVAVTKGTIERYCQEPCLISSDYYFINNNTCSPSCFAPYIQYTEGVSSFCKFPCLTSEYLYWNNTCSSYCPSSFQQVRNGDKYCQFYCENGESLYWNQTCKSSCPAPLVSSADSQSYKSCNLPCNQNEYLYPNGSCISSCSYQARVGSDGVTYCDYPCSSTLYQYQNNSCIPTCSAPYSVKIVDAYLSQCISPCLSGQFYVRTTDSCVNTCDSASTVIKSGVLKICEPSSESVDHKSLGGTVDAILAGMNTAAGFLRPNDPNSPFVVALAKLIKYAQYIDVPILPDIRESFNAGASSGFSITQMFSVNMPESLADKFPERNLPGLLGQGGLSSSYLVNHWNTITSYLFLSLVGIFFWITEKLIRKTEKRLWILIFRRLRILTKWNFLLFAFFNTYDDLTYFAILEFKTLHFESAAEIMSFIVCILTTLFSIYMMVKLFVVCKGAVNIKRQVININGITPERHFYNNHESYQILYAGLRNDSFLSQGYIFFFTLRIIICYLIVGFLYEHPVIQSVQLTFLSLLMFIYLIKYKPIKDPFNVVVSFTYETLILFGNICLVILGVESATGKLTAEMQYRLSRCLLIANTLINTISSIFSYAYLVMGAWSAYKSSKAFGLDGKTSWITVPASPYSNPGMDFDDLTYEFMDSSEKKLVDEKRMSRIKMLIYKRAKAKLPVPRSSLVHETKIGETSAKLVSMQSSNNIEITSLNNFGQSDLDMEKRRSSLSIMSLSSPSSRPLRFSDQLGFANANDFVPLSVNNQVVIGKRSKKVQGFEEVLLKSMNKNSGLILEENTLENQTSDRNKVDIRDKEMQSELDITGQSRITDSSNRISSYIQHPSQRRLIMSNRKDSLVISSGEEIDLGVSLDGQNNYRSKEKRKNIRRSRIIPTNSYTTNSELIGHQNEKTRVAQNSLISVFNTQQNKDSYTCSIKIESIDDLKNAKQNSLVQSYAKKSKILNRLKGRGVAVEKLDN